MSCEYFGIRFDEKDPWGYQEKWITESLINQIDQKWPNDKNLIINTTWLGPAFDSWQELLTRKFECDNLFWFAIVDPVCMQSDHFELIESKIGANTVRKVGLGFPGEYYFSTSAVATLEDFPDYSTSDIQLQNVLYKYLCYNRKPKPHRIKLVEKFFEHSLHNHGIITLGANDSNYDVSNGVTQTKTLTINETYVDYTRNGKFNQQNSFSGIPLDVCSLGRLDIWNNHFLNVVTETEFFPWDNLFITEKTWKPILGLRPFIINGQPQIYTWLEQNGFKTFNHYWNFVDLKTISENDIHDRIIEVVKYVCNLSVGEINEIYQDMLPDLQYNRHRFFEYAKEQKQRILSLF